MLQKKRKKKQKTKNTNVVRNGNLPWLALWDLCAWCLSVALAGVAMLLIFFFHMLLLLCGIGRERMAGILIP